MHDMIDCRSTIGRFLAFLALLAMPGMAPVMAQEAGCHYSPLPGEGDRASLGRALNSTPELFACLAVRCENDFSIGVHIHTGRSAGDSGDWRITIDKEEREFTAMADGAPYGARISGDIDWVLDGLRNGATAYIHPLNGAALMLNSIPLSGSLHAINSALAFCAPRVRAAPVEPNEGGGV